jgi:hypothetical protein
MSEDKSIDTMAMELAEKSITRLLSVIRNGEAGDVSLVEDQISEEVYLDLMRQFFERLGLPAPQAILDCKETKIVAQHTMVGKSVMISATYTTLTLPHCFLSAKLG